MYSIKKGVMITCQGSDSSFGDIPLWVQGEVPAYRRSVFCEDFNYRFGDVRPAAFVAGFALFDGFLLYPCEGFYTEKANIRDEICDFHNKGSMKSLHVVYKGAKMGDKVVVGRGQGLEFGFSDIYDGNTMSYGNFVGVFNPASVYDDRWILSVGNKEGSYTFDGVTSSPGENQEVIGDKTLRSYFYPHVPADSTTPENAFILSVGVFGTLSSHHLVQSCVKGAPDGHCVHSKAITFTKGGSDMLVMALPNDMENYYFEYAVSELSSTVVVAYFRIIFMTSVVKNNMIDSFQKIVFFSNEVAGGLFLATNLRRCNGAFNMCIRDDKKLFTLTFLGYTTPQQVQGMLVHGGDIVVEVADKNCQAQNSQCVVTAELFAYRNTQMWIENMKDTHNGVINPDENYRAMIFQDLTIVIEPVDKVD